MIIIHYDPIQGAPITDGSVEIICTNVIRLANLPDNHDVSFSTDNILEHVLTAIAEEKVLPERIQFLYNGQLLQPNRFGVIPNMSQGFLDRICVVIENRLIAAVNRRKREKQAHLDAIEYTGEQLSA